MNEKLRQLASQAGLLDPQYSAYSQNLYQSQLVKYAELIKQAIYDQVKEELIPDDLITAESPELQEYLKGCNGGTVDALCHIKNFAVDFDPRIM